MWVVKIRENEKKRVMGWQIWGFLAKKSTYEVAKRGNVWDDEDERDKTR